MKRKRSRRGNGSTRPTTVNADVPQLTLVCGEADVQFGVHWRVILRFAREWVSLDAFALGPDMRMIAFITDAHNARAILAHFFVPHA